MPLYKIDPPSDYLFRGHFLPQKVGDILHPFSCPTCLGDLGRHLFASHSYLYAAAYGLKNVAFSIDMAVVYGNRLPHVVAREDAGLVLFNSKSQPPFGVTLNELLRQTVYLQHLPSGCFRGVLRTPPEPQEGPPIEWASREPEYVHALDLFTVKDALSWGVQFFTVPKDVFDNERAGQRTPDVNVFFQKRQAVWINPTVGLWPPRPCSLPQRARSPVREQDPN